MLHAGTLSVSGGITNAKQEKYISLIKPFNNNYINIDEILCIHIHVHIYSNLVVPSDIF